MKRIGEAHREIDSTSARSAQNRATEIERRQYDRQLKRQQKKQAQLNNEKAEFRSKFVGPIILILTAIVSYLIWILKS